MFNANVVKVLLSTPGDTTEEVAAITRSLHGWNGSRAEAAGVVLLPRHWKVDAVPRLGTGSGQAVINTQLVDDADIVLALFDSRLGQATAEAVSGTAEEIEHAIDSGKQVHVWFSNERIARDADLKQIAALQKFQSGLQEQGLLGEYDNLDDLAFKVRAAIEDDLTRMGLDSTSAQRRAGAEHAMPRARRSGDHLTIENKSRSVTAEQLTYTLSDVWPANWGETHDENADGATVALMYDGDPVDLLPDSELSWSMMAFGQSPPQLKVTMAWLESDEAHEISQNIALY